MEFLGQRSEEKSNSSENGVLEIGMDDPNPNQTPQKHYQRYSSQQVLRMLEFYEKNTHPDENERQTLGEELDLDPLRVKFWFQNRRSQNKKKDEKTLNKQLREENEKLRIDNGMLKHAIGFPICKKCGRPYTYETAAARVELLRAENAFIKDEIHRVTPLLQKYCGPEVLSYPVHATTSSSRASGARNGRGSGSAAENEKSAGKKPKRNE